MYEPIVDVGEDGRERTGSRWFRPSIDLISSMCSVSTSLAWYCEIRRKWNGSVAAIVVDHSAP